MNNKNLVEHTSRIREKLVKIDNAVEEFDTTFPEDAEGKLAMLAKLHAARWRLLSAIDLIDSIEFKVFS